MCLLIAQRYPTLLSARARVNDIGEAISTALVTDPQTFLSVTKSLHQTRRCLKIEKRGDHLRSPRSDGRSAR